MQLINFDVWGMLIALLTFFSTCSSTTSIQPTSQQLVLPSTKVPGDPNYDTVSSKLTLILLDNNNLYAYEGTDVSKGSRIANNSIAEIVASAKKKFSAANFMVVIKPTDGASYKQTVDVLDEMITNKIDRYSLEKLNPEEIHHLQVKEKKIID